MADSRPVGRVIWPWEGTGWPLDLFKYQEVLLAEREYLCTRIRCGRVLKDAIQLECPHKLCKECLDTLYPMPAQEWTCEACVRVSDDEAADVQVVNLPNAVSSREKCEEGGPTAKAISKMEVVCPYKCGTTHVGEKPLRIKTLEKHMNECNQRLISCLKCSEEVKYSDFEAHLCTNRIVEAHQADSERKTSQCNICGEMYAGSRDSHLEKECRTSLCPFGCTDMRPGEMIKDHLKDRSKIEVHTFGLKRLLESLSVSRVVPTFNVQRGITPTQMTAILDSLVQLECRTDRVERKLRSQLEKMSGETATEFYNNTKMVESNRIALAEIDVLSKLLAADLDLGRSYTFVVVRLTEKLVKERDEISDLLRKLEESSNIAVPEARGTLVGQYQRMSYTGRLMERIDGVESKRYEVMESQPFYTEMCGYKMCARIYLNGDGEGRGTHVSLFFVLMEGQYDTLLVWPFQQKVTMKLKNQGKKRPDIVEKFRPDPSSSSFAQPQNEMNVASGCPQFATQKMVFSDSAGYVVDDTMFIEIIVDNSYQELHGLHVSVQETRGASSR